MKQNGTYSDTISMGRIEVCGNEFHVNGSRIWINGANTPWKSWNDFGGDFSYEWWDNHFKELHEHGVNATRIWISCNGQIGIYISEDGTVTGATDKYWADLDGLFEIALRHKVYIMATITSFDHFKTHHDNYQSWRNMISSDEKVEQYINNYVIPLVNRYKSNTALWCIDLCNEPDWVNQNEECGRISWDILTAFFAKCTYAIHNNSTLPVTVGIGVTNNNSKVNDESMRAVIDDPAACLDFYSPHYYPWMDKHFGIPFYTTPEKYGVDTGKPVVIAECPAKGSTGHTLVEDYEQAFENGWQGVMPWTSNGVDVCGDLSDMGAAVKEFSAKHKELIITI